MKNSDDMTVAQPQSPFVQGSVLYKEFLAEREEILKHKWIESEKAGSDIGFEKALVDWIVKHRSNWRDKRQKEGRAQAENAGGDQPTAGEAATQEEEQQAHCPITPSSAPGKPRRLPS